MEFTIFWARNYEFDGLWIIRKHPTKIREQYLDNRALYYLKKNHLSYLPNEQKEFYTYDRNRSFTCQRSFCK